MPINPNYQPEYIDALRDLRALHRQVEDLLEDLERNQDQKGNDPSGTIFMKEIDALKRLQRAREQYFGR